MQPNSIHKISLIVPAYKQEKTIVQNIKKMASVMEQLPYDYEIILIIDGRLDKTYEKIKKFESAKIRIYQYEKNQGKGYAIRYGGLKAKGDIVGFIDAGMDIDPTGVSMLLNHMLWYDADIIVGSKMHPVSKVNYPFYRKLLSWGYRTFTGILFGFKVRDTQAGIKFYKKQVVEDVFPRLLVKTFAFDVEILALSYALGYRRIYEAPIKLKFRGVSSITSGNLWKTIILMLWDTLAVFYRVRLIKYYRNSNRKNWIGGENKQKTINRKQ
jgi:glycosyltransferase involved in cell wall biosynthesis